jgi:hypothetical protein
MVTGGRRKPLFLCSGHSEARESLEGLAKGIRANRGGIAARDDQASGPSLATMLGMEREENLQHILGLCERERQRITYKALADYLGKRPQQVMRWQPRNQLHSWVVSKKKGLPTKYPADCIHPNLMEHKKIIYTADELQAFIERHPRPVNAKK